MFMMVGVAGGDYAATLRYGAPDVLKLHGRVIDREALAQNAI